jgi:hypothetical protein
MDTPIKDTPARHRNTAASRTPRPREHIEGWGADLDRRDRPADPMERQPPRLEAQTLEPPVQQAQDSRVFHSIERPGLTPVFGTTVPPSGVSGAMRRVAFRYSENDLRHWLLLLLADRVNMVEGLASDLAHGHVPNIYREMGGRAELRHNPRGAVKKAVVLAAVAGIGYWAWRRRAHRGRFEDEPRP